MWVQDPIWGKWFHWDPEKGSCHADGPTSQLVPLVYCNQPIQFIAWLVSLRSPVWQPFTAQSTPEAAAGCRHRVYSMLTLFPAGRKPLSNLKEPAMVYVYLVAQKQLKSLLPFASKHNANRGKGVFYSPGISKIIKCSIGSRESSHKKDSFSFVCHCYSFFNCSTNQHL